MNKYHSQIEYLREKSVDNQNLNAFIAVAESKSFSEAANLLDVTQTTISKRIALLESTIAQKFFDRIARQVTLTEAVLELITRAIHLLKPYESALKSIYDPIL